MGGVPDRSRRRGTLTGSRRGSRQREEVDEQEEEVEELHEDEERCGWGMVHRPQVLSRLG